jgi:hypothetical protein
MIPLNYFDVTGFWGQDRSRLWMKTSFLHLRITIRYRCYSSYQSIYIWFVMRGESLFIAHGGLLEYGFEKNSYIRPEGVTGTKGCYAHGRRVIWLDEAAKKAEKEAADRMGTFRRKRRAVVLPGCGR